MRGKLIGFAKITRDLTERRDAQKQLEQSREQLFQSQKMEAVGQLTGGLAHDFNNLLTGIIGSLELMKRRMAQGRIADLERYITAAQGAASRAAALTHRLLAFARRQTLDPKPISANQLIADMEDLLQRTVGPAIELETVLRGRPRGQHCAIPTNWRTRSSTCASMLATPCQMAAGSRSRPPTRRWIDREARARDMQPGQYVAIGVTDTGTGMPPDVVAHAFEPFFTTKPTGQGTGLGLSMIYGFAKQSGGQVRIYSEVGVRDHRAHLPAATLAARLTQEVRSGKDRQRRRRREPTRRS